MESDQQKPEKRKVWVIDYKYFTVCYGVLLENERYVVLESGTEFVVKPKKEVYSSREKAVCVVMKRIADEIAVLTQRMNDLSSGKE